MVTLPTTRVLRLEHHGWWLGVTMDDPETRNALTSAMVEDWERVLSATAGDRGLRALVIQGVDGRFCAGANLKGDVSGKPPAVGQPDPVREENKRGGRLFHALNRHPMAVIAVVDGPAMGGGFGLACCADVVITTPRARFSLSETTLGLAPAQIAPFVIGRLGLAATRRLSLTGARFDGAYARVIGLSDHHCETPDEAAEQLRRCLADVSRCAPGANAATKALLLEVAAGATDPIERAADVFTTCLRSGEGEEGVAAFAAKRRPAWAEVA